MREIISASDTKHRFKNFSIVKTPSNLNPTVHFSFYNIFEPISRPMWFDFK
jgi:hypothetical protein